MRRLAGLTSILVAAAAALVILAIAVTPFLSPAWISFEQDRAHAAEWTGYSEADLRTATDAILSDLVAGPPNFDVSVAGELVLTAAERSHMQDVRNVFTLFYLAAGAGLVILVIARLVASRAGGWPRARFLGAIRAGSAGLGAAIVIGGIVGAVAFDAAFEVFHRLFFATGTYTFDPRTDRLVQLFPGAFWSETTIAVASVTLGLALTVLIVTSRRLRGAGQELDASGETAT